MSASKPELSVVLITDQQRERGAGALASLLAQSEIDRLEIILIDLGSGEREPIAGSDHPSVRVHADIEAETYGIALAEGVQRARAPVVAFLEEHAHACPGWAAALLEAHRGEWAGVGCLVHPARPDNRISAAMSLVNDRSWLPGSRGGESDAIRGHNASYKRDVLIDLAGELPRWLEFEPLLQDHLRASGHRLLVEPRARIVHFNDSTLGSMAHVYRVWNRALGPARADYCNWGRLGRLARVAALPFLPFLRTARLAWSYRREPGHLMKVLWLAPEILAANGSAALGQAIGLLSGPGDGLRQFMEHELNADREGVPPDVGCR